MATKAELIAEVKALPEIEEVLLENIHEIINLSDGVALKKDGQGNFPGLNPEKRYLLWQALNVLEVNDNSAYRKNIHFYNIVGPSGEDKAYYQVGGGANKPGPTIGPIVDPIIQQINTKIGNIPNYFSHRILFTDKTSNIAFVEVILNDGTKKNYTAKNITSGNFSYIEIV